MIHSQVEDLFYNVPSRRRAFRSASEEYAKILDLVGRYAVHCSGVAFSCKKHGGSSTDITVPVAASTVDRIRQIHGSALANELVNLKVENDRWGFKCDGWISNANYNVKRTTLLLFINHRSVESAAIKKSIEQTYATFLPKGGHPFVYLSLDIEPQRVDVNVHPTKREVHFLNEDEIISIICEEICAGLSKVDTSRAFMTQSLLSNNPKAPFVTPMKPTAPSASSTVSARHDRSTSKVPPKSSTKKPYENSLVRTDSSVRKITSMLQTQPSIDDGHPSFQDDSDQEYVVEGKEPGVCRLASIKELRGEVRDAMHNELTDIIATHTFVGVVDEQKRIVAIQAGIKLFLVDYGMLCNEYFYQVALTDFSFYGTIRFEKPLDLRELLQIGAEQEQRNMDSASASDDEDMEVDWNEVVESVRSKLIDRRALILEYFSMDITPEGLLCTIPLLIKGYTPSFAKLPGFLLRLGPYVDWEAEKECFQSFLRELAAFYTPESLPLSPSSTPKQDAGKNTEEDSEMNEAEEKEEDPEITKRRERVRRALENVIFPACKARMVGTSGLLKGFLELADLKGLYRVFERC
ncbi:unnamed protein product [Periconia digitata]|uniref:DNA mismatch repair protein S5 domain-containing protein n=1 Tax=Periconia digitata TaxID=1303443 RepID=A0A9W4U458_9PLEO|nr:unnamed protein product [Periconia digitata]